jgi:serine protease Do
VEIERGFLGVSIQPVNDDLADSLGLPRNRGEFVQIVQEDGAAARAGIKPGDVVTAINGQNVTSEQTLSFLVANIAPGTRIPIDLIRDGEEMRLMATISKRPSEDELRQQQFDPDAEPTEPPAESDGTIEEKLGLQVLELTPQIIQQLGADEDTVGLVIGAVDPNADAARKGLRRGDIIISANYREVGEIADLVSIISEAEASGREAVLLRIQRRGGSTAYFPVRLR